MLSGVGNKSYQNVAVSDRNSIHKIDSNLKSVNVERYVIVTSLIEEMLQVACSRNSVLFSSRDLNFVFSIHPHARKRNTP